MNKIVAFRRKRNLLIKKCKFFFGNFHGLNRTALTVVSSRFPKKKTKTDERIWKSTFIVTEKQLDVETMHKNHNSRSNSAYRS